MMRYTAEIKWERGEPRLPPGRYSRVHKWRFDGGIEIRASASPHVVPEPLSDAAAVDPEEAFVAALASCHMLWYLAIAVRRGWRVEHYADEAEGFMMDDENGKPWIGRVVLHPTVRYTGDAPSSQEERAIHEAAHDECFIARSVRTEVVVAA